MRLVTNIQSGDVFYTDLNGFQVGLHTDSVILLKIKEEQKYNKVLNMAMRFPTDFLQIQPRRYFMKLPLQANFYPMPSQAYIQDSNYRLTLHTAQALGVSSLESGWYS